MAIPYPEIDPVLLRVGPIAVRWYGLAYLAGLVAGWRYVRWMSSRPPFPLTLPQVDDFLVWATLGVVLGGRTGYILFYKPLYYIAHPIEIFTVWQGGMSFHGGALGVIIAIIAFARMNRIDMWALGDVICPAVPIGLFLGRLANFVNGELFGRPAPDDLPWAMVFPNGGPLPRHPSQLYEAGLEGIVLFLILHLVWRSERLRLMKGLVAGVFLAGYGLARITAEFFREPDANLGYLWGGATMGQLLSIPLVAAGLFLIARAVLTSRRPLA